MMKASHFYHFLDVAAAQRIDQQPLQRILCESESIAQAVDTLRQRGLEVTIPLADWLMMVDVCRQSGETHQRLAEAEVLRRSWWVRLGCWLGWC
jgi:hypothetical protein